MKHDPLPTGSPIIIFLGPPGSGKGTQAARLASELGVPAISTGEMLRQECRSGSRLGIAVQNLLLSGQLVNDDVMNEVVASRLAKPDCAYGCILDGYPRTVAQARFLDILLIRSRRPLPIVFDFDISPEEVVTRLAKRRQCAVCGTITSADSSSPAVDLFCPNDGSKLIQRSDDQPAAIRERLRMFERNAQDLVRYYEDREYYRVTANRSPSQVAEDLLRMLNSQVPAGILVLQSLGSTSPHQA